MNHGFTILNSSPSGTQVEATIYLIMTPFWNRLALQTLDWEIDLRDVVSNEISMSSLE